MAGWFIESSKVKKRYFGKRRMGTSRRLSEWRFKRLQNLASQAVKQIRPAITLIAVGGWDCSWRGCDTPPKKQRITYFLGATGRPENSF
jgi:hypothetical protein